MKSYRDLEIYQIAFQLALEVHHLTISKLPKYELYEQGSQVRRASQSIKNNIVEGYGRRRYKAEFIRFLVFAHSSNDETINQLEMLNVLYFQKAPICDLIDQFDILGRKLNTFIQYVETSWKI